MVHLKIDTVANSFLIASIEPVRKVCRKELYLKGKRPSDIAAACRKLFGFKMLRPNLVFNVT